MSVMRNWNGRNCKAKKNKRLASIKMISIIDACTERKWMRNIFVIISFL